jgi:YebC/PmpR family DNA-binding regulatory protein
MAGHSKWHNIRIRKGKQDALRSKLFTKLAREITVAAKQGGGNPDANPRLRLAIEKARENHMPADNIKRAIQKGTGELEGASYEEITYEGYGPGGVAIMVECMTDNRNRTVAELRHLFSKHGGNLGETGSVAWQFKRQGVITIPAEAITEEELLEIALEAGRGGCEPRGGVLPRADDRRGVPSRARGVARARAAHRRSATGTDAGRLPCAWRARPRRS